MPPLAAPGVDASAAQIEERAFWMRREIAIQGISAMCAAKYDELIDIIEAHNAEAQQ